MKEEIIESIKKQILYTLSIYECSNRSMMLEGAYRLLKDCPYIDDGEEICADDVFRCAIDSLVEENKVSSDYFATNTFYEKF